MRIVCCVHGSVVSVANVDVVAGWTFLSTTTDGSVVWTRTTRTKKRERPNRCCKRANVVTPEGTEKVGKKVMAGSDPTGELFRSTAWSIIAVPVFQHNGHKSLICHLSIGLAIIYMFLNVPSVLLFSFINSSFFPSVSLFLLMDPSCRGMAQQGCVCVLPRHVFNHGNRHTASLSLSLLYRCPSSVCLSFLWSDHTVRAYSERTILARWSLVWRKYT